MSTLMASYTTAISRLLVLPSSSGVPSRSSVAFKPSYSDRSPRPLTITCALPEKERPAFSIPPTALLCPVPPPDGKERWDIKEDEDGVTLWLQVPGVSVDDIEVTTSANGDVLEIKRKRASGSGASGQQAADVHGVGAFHIRLLITSEYDRSKVAADLKDGMLEVSVPKIRKEQRKRKPVPFGSPPRWEGASPEVSDDKTKPNKTNNETKGSQPARAS